MKIISRQAFPITVTYNAQWTVEWPEMVRSAKIDVGNQDHIDPLINQTHFPIEGKPGAWSRTFEVIHFEGVDGEPLDLGGRVAFFSEIEEGLQSIGLRHADLEELLSFSAVCPDLASVLARGHITDGSRWLVAMGSPHYVFPQSGVIGLPMLRQLQRGERGLSLSGRGSGSLRDDDHAIAAVRAT